VHVTLPVNVIAWSWRTPLGADVDAVVDRLCAGAIAAIANPEPAYRVRAIAPIAGAAPRTRHDRFVRRLGGHAIDAATEVARAARLAPDIRLGLYAAVGGLRAHWDDMLPALVRQQGDGADAWALGLREIHPFWMLRHLSNNVHALVATDLGARGDGATYGGASAGGQAIAAASWALHAGAIDTAIVLAYDSLLEPETLVELGERGAASMAPAGEVIAPYHESAAGFVPGEAAAALVLARPDDPRARLATITAGDESPAEVVDGAGLGDPRRDRAERERLAKTHAGTTPLTAISAAFGQLGAATPLVQTIALARALVRRTIPPIAGARAPAPGPLAIVTTARATHAHTALALGAGEPALSTALRIEVP
jgi:3-oxoacyl-(acyl-carrier-protein) synthase